MLWILLEHWIQGAQMKCIEFDSQLTFTRKMFLDYIVLKIHYTKSSSQQFMIRNIEDFQDITSYLELCILCP